MSKYKAEFIGGGSVVVNNTERRNIHVLELSTWYESVFRPVLHTYLGFEDTITRNLSLRNWYTDEDFMHVIFDLMMVDVLGTDAHVKDFSIITSLIEAVGGEGEWERIAEELFDSLSEKGTLLEDVKRTMDVEMPFILSMGKMFYFVKE